jgi:hypothetical protein
VKASQQTDGDALIYAGNAAAEGAQDGRRGWFLGHFRAPESGLPHSEEVEMKWGIHRQGEEKTALAANRTAFTLSILISGAFSVWFPAQAREVLLTDAGDYVLFAPGVAHTWRALEDTVILSVRWPSVPEDQQPLG